MSAASAKKKAAGHDNGASAKGGAQAKSGTSPARFGKVAVLFGGASNEREISIMSGTGVLKALQSKGVDAHAFDPSVRDLADLKREGYARCFIALHGRGGEDGTIQGALEVLGVPYTGSGVMGSAIGMDKWRTKMIWLANDLPTPRYRILQGDEDAAEVARDLGLPLIVKPANEGSTLGLTKVTNAARLPAAFELAAKQYNDIALAEQFIDGPEYTAAVLGDVVLPLIKIEAPEGKYDYQNKYFTDDTRYLCPCGLPKEPEEDLKALVHKAFRLVGCSGWGRVDFMMDKKGNPWLLEVNTSPGMTGHSLVPMAAKAAGISYEDLCVRILEQTLEARG
jgi:D-alanine-D-alanine ligase